MRVEAFRKLRFQIFGFRGIERAGDRGGPHALHTGSFQLPPSSFKTAEPRKRRSKSLFGRRDLYLKHADAFDIGFDFIAGF